MYFINILYSETLDVYYKDFSAHVQSRLENHLHSKNKFTSQVRDWQPFCVKSFEPKHKHSQL